ncbi:MAG TPA: DJ-1/PfpI family protein [Lachnospiraceae bacterium]|nr:DJ-1/PfpI family protein [Lachnospiraceae bacterium]
MKVNIFLFNNFETLDAFGPVEVLGGIEEYTLQYTSITGGRVVSRQGVEVETISVKDITSNDILLVPGGQGTRELVNDEDFISHLKCLADQARYCLTVCTGSALLARTGLLDGRRATSNKRAFDWAASMSEEAQWIGNARWVVDDKYYTSSGVSAGIDMTLGFIADQFGMDRANGIAQRIEYLWNSDRNNDPFSIK